MTGLIQTLITIALFALILGVLVVIHEIGHFVTARLFGVRVLEFGVGFPPRARVVAEGKVDPADAEYAERLYEAEQAAVQRTGDVALMEEFLDREPPVAHGTAYTANWLPIGGFVKLEGEDGDEGGRVVEVGGRVLSVPMGPSPRSFSVQPWWRKMVILAAGVAMNVVLAFVIFTAIALGGDPTIGIRIGAIQPGSPAADAGVVPGDALVSIDGGYYGAFDGGTLFDALQDRAGQTIELGLERADGTYDTVTVTLRDAAAVAAGQGALGVSGLTAMTTDVSIGYTPIEAVGIGAERTVNALGLIVNGLGELVRSVAEDPTAPPPVAGPVGIATQIGEVFWQLGPIVTLYVAGILSANLAVVNILPFPPLDGGRMLVITLKSLLGQRISLRAERLTYLLGFVFLFAFLIWITGFDILRNLTGGS